MKIQVNQIKLYLKIKLQVKKIQVEENLGKTKIYQN